MSLPLVRPRLQVRGATIKGPKALILSVPGLGGAGSPAGACGCTFGFNSSMALVWTAVRNAPESSRALCSLVSPPLLLSQHNSGEQGAILGLSDLVTFIWGASRYQSSLPAHAVTERLALFSAPPRSRRSGPGEPALSSVTGPGLEASVAAHL